MFIFYDSMQLMAIATDESVSLVVQFPLKPEESTYTVCKAIPIPTFQPDIQNFMQIGRTREWFAISADFRKYLRLDFDYITHCRIGYITFCDFRGAILDRRSESCTGGLFFGKPDVAVRYCERLIVGQKLEPRMVKVRAHPPVRLYAVSGILTFVSRCANGSHGLKVRISKIGLLRQPNGWYLVNDVMILKARRTYGWQYKIEYGQIVLPKSEGLFTARELRLLQEDPEGTKAALDQVNEELHQHGLHVNTYQLLTQVREEREDRQSSQWLWGNATMGGVSLPVTVMWCGPVTTSDPRPVEVTNARSLQHTATDELQHGRDNGSRFDGAWRGRTPPERPGILQTPSQLRVSMTE
jgi:hypothetical protein